ncbi:hypothetical protein DB992_04160 [Salmonella enterica]|nr:hypothetical protein [Salmonella enterica]EBF0273483.1 hypothetical protein [Salmonella enterica]EBN4820592.1 hypothetical protein [Salmonella enterica]ECW1186195.1 hypothetical protein [Salmonella enterica]EDT6512730.1 hypothetical protein [Salmonella enterica subsp. enterica serovar Tallahassee]
MNIHSTENNLSNLLDKNEQSLNLFRSKIVLILLQNAGGKFSDGNVDASGINSHKIFQDLAQIARYLINRFLVVFGHLG